MVRHKALTEFLGTYFGSQTNEKRCWQAKPKLDCKEINLTVQVG
jgi:hypothetical protein